MSEEDYIANVEKKLIGEIDKYRSEKLYKFAGAGLSTCVCEIFPRLHAMIWKDLDMVPLIFELNSDRYYSKDITDLVEEQADSMARKCLE